VNVETSVIELMLKQKASLPDEAKIFAERKIRNGVINKQKTKCCNRQPKQHFKKEMNRSLNSKYPGVHDS